MTISRHCKEGMVFRGLLVLTVLVIQTAYGWTTSAGSSRRLRAKPDLLLHSRLSSTTRVYSKSKETSSDEKKKIVIVGGGFGGLTCKNELQNLMPSSDILIVEPNERFCFLPLLYEFLGGTAELDEIAPTYDDLLSSPPIPRALRRGRVSSTRGKVNMKRASALHVDPNDNTLTVRCSTGETEHLKYDGLVLGLGLPPLFKKSNAPGRANIPSTAYSFATLDDAIRLKRRLGAVPTDSPSSIVIVGGGYVGAELACTLSKMVPPKCQLTILHRDPTTICNVAESYNQESAADRLNSLGVNVKLGVTVTDVTTTTTDGNVFPTDEILYTKSNGEEDSISADILIWTVAGASNHPREIVSGLPTNEKGRIIVSPTLQVQGTENIFAIGDGAIVVSDTSASETDNAPSDSPYPGNAQVAMQQASVAAYNLELQIDGRIDDSSKKPKTFQYLSLGEMLSLGGDEDASISSLNGLFKLNGPLASIARRLVYAARMPSPKQVVRSGATYLRDGFVRRISDSVERAADRTD